MSNASLLATVRAAANAPALPATAGNQPEENTMSNATDKPAAPATITSLAALQAAYPEFCGQLQTAARTEGATAERERIAAIDKLARPGREKIIADAKADATMTADKTAIAILAADDAKRDAALAGIKSVEDEGGKVKASHTPTGQAPAGEQQQLKGATPDEWKAEYAASAALQSEFASVEDYVAIRKAEVGGKVRVLGARGKAA